MGMNSKVVMNKLSRILLLCCLATITFNMARAYGQQNHFVYIQADDKQSFSVNINGKTYNSSAIGYVIVPKLTDGKYQALINFPDNKFPEQQFTLAVNKADAGFA